MNDNLWFLIAACALATYFTRIGGYLILSRFGALNHRLEAALEAVPVAVLSALVAPSLISHGPAEAITLVIAGLLAIRLSMMASVAIGLVMLVALRAFIG